MADGQLLHALVPKPIRASLITGRVWIAPLHACSKACNRAHNILEPVGLERFTPASRVGLGGTIAVLKGGFYLVGFALVWGAGIETWSFAIRTLGALVKGHA